MSALEALSVESLKGKSNKDLVAMLVTERQARMAEWSERVAEMARQPMAECIIVLPNCPPRDPTAYNDDRGHVELQLKGCEAFAIKRLLAAVHGRPLSTGRLVQTRADAVRWLIGELARAIGCESAAAS